MAVSFQKAKQRLVTLYHLTQKELSQTVSSKHILQIQRTISWWAVGRILLDRVVLNDITKDAFDEEQRRDMMLNKWQEKRGSGATYEKLIDAMIEVEKTSEAEGVCQLIAPVTPGK